MTATLALNVLKNRRQIMLVILGEFNQLLFPLKSLEYLRFFDELKEK